MSNRSLRDERILARELYVHDGFTPLQIASRLGVHPDTVRSWCKQNHWEADREETIVTGIEIAVRIKKLIVRLLDGIDENLDHGDGVSELTLKRLDHYTKSLLRLDGSYDEKGSMMLAMRKFVRFLSKTGNVEAIRVLNTALPPFYRSLSEQ
ncbi:MAG: hypothetical protein JSS75_01910 [Bacteroidetes bacterium]|nr:hypothetical protein [Bacteroidota bacterium]